MMLFPLSGFPLADEYIRDSGLNVPWLRDGHVYFSTLADAGAFARQLGAENRAIELLKAMLLMAALQEKSHSQDFVLWSASQNPALSLLHSCLRAPAGDISSYAKAAHEPVLHAPDSLDRQLQYVLQHWNDISPATRARIHVILQYDFSAKLAPPAEDFPPVPPASIPGPVNYSYDAGWMRGLVAVARNVPLWLAQLSREYSRKISRLDEIPAEEFQFLKSCGVNGIWLVGLWQRSEASAIIKRKSGNPTAFSSAYSVFAYETDPAYGGEAALDTFLRNAHRTGISVGCDMVPNHTGIDSQWMREHPDWFMQTPAKPFPGYRYDSENISRATGSETRIEDKYYTHADAAVVFRHDCAGETRYIYHGNDGTGLPWNDTAQLNHLLPEVRAALIETALKLAQKFAFIRFDAAMTLLKEHYRRLWFPAPYATPVIASRAVFAMADTEFDNAMPEFWSELVAAFAEKSPGTLLMAEAFWLTENYFIRNIGMHRVYNSALMHFLAAEQNADFSSFMREHLREPETLNRFVNYLSTPDEQPAAEIFGSADKYFGAMKLVATLPGLPLIAPGQLEGFTEKYAMDQQEPRLHESKRREFVERHQREIAPLLKLRDEFNDARKLQWLEPDGDRAAECIIAYETGSTKRVRVLFNNSPEARKCRIKGEQFSFGPYESRVVFDPVVAITSHNPQTPKKTSSHAAYPQLDRYHAGVTVPVNALRSKLSCGIGEFTDIKLLVDWCTKTGQDFIALLPVCDTGSNPSPYSALSAFALHPVYLRLDEIPGFAHIQAEVEEFRTAGQTGKVFRFDDVLEFKIAALRKIYASSPEACLASLPAGFADQQWLLDYAVYKSIKSRLGEAPAYAWPEYPAKPHDIAELLDTNTPENRRQFFSDHRQDAAFYIWLQYHCEQQLVAAARYARARGIYLKGDLPILLERDSVDVWLNPQLFRHELKAGAPPDNFSADGQNWGFPVYDWLAHRADNYAWWKSRVRHAEKFFAAYRIDHVLGFFRIWCLDADDSSGYCGFFLPSSSFTEAELAPEISAERLALLSDPANRERPFIKNRDNYFPAWDFQRKLAASPIPEETKRVLEHLVVQKTRDDAALQRAQGYEILQVLKSASPMLPCAEDLGVVPDYVSPTLGELSILSLCVLRWRHRGAVLESPRDYSFLSVATPSVHDSSNLREWLRDEGSRYFPGDDALHSALAAIYDSASVLALVPIQDLLALDAALHGSPEKERINVPGTVSEKNWSYRIPLFLEDLIKREGLNQQVRILTARRSTKQVPGQ